MSANRSWHGSLRLLSSLAAASALSLACFWSLRYAYADFLSYKGSLAGLRRAAQLAPENAQYQMRIGTLDPSSRYSKLESALTLNPYYSRGWIERGLRAEMKGDWRTAEGFLLKAADVDRTYEPRWALVNYYFRRADWEDFWVWARKAAAIAYYDQSALFELCWRATENKQVILDRAIPDRPPILRQYLGFLLRSNRLDAAEPVAGRLLSLDASRNLDLLLTYCDRLLEADQASDAVRLWNSLSKNRAISYMPLVPEQGLSLTNGGFVTMPLSHGFDWRFGSSRGVTLARTRSPSGLRITFSGRQPDNCGILEQLLPLEPSRNYIFRFRYKTSGIPPESGLRWAITDVPTGKKLSVFSSNLSEEDWTEGILKFSTPSSLRLTRLALLYGRTPGTTRSEGSLFLQEVKLDLEH